MLIRRDGSPAGVALEDEDEDPDDGEARPEPGDEDADEADAAEPERDDDDEDADEADADAEPGRGRCLRQNQSGAPGPILGLHVRHRAAMHSPSVAVPPSHMVPSSSGAMVMPHCSQLVSKFTLDGVVTAITGGSDAVACRCSLRVACTRPRSVSCSVGGRARVRRKSVRRSVSCS